MWDSCIEGRTYLSYSYIKANSSPKNQVFFNKASELLLAGIIKQCVSFTEPSLYDFMHMIMII